MYIVHVWVGEVGFLYFLSEVFQLVCCKHISHVCGEKLGGYWVGFLVGRRWGATGLGSLWGEGGGLLGWVPFIPLLSVSVLHTCIFKLCVHVRKHVDKG